MKITAHQVSRSTEMRKSQARQQCCRCWHSGSNELDLAGASERGRHAIIFETTGEVHSSY